MQDKCQRNVWIQECKICVCYDFVNVTPDVWSNSLKCLGVIEYEGYIDIGFFVNLPFPKLLLSLKTVKSFIRFESEIISTQISIQEYLNIKLTVR